MPAEVKDQSVVRKQPGSAAPQPVAQRPAASPPRARLGEEPSLTIHRVLEICDPEKKHAAILLEDLFDGRPRVIRSAISAAGATRLTGSFKYLVRLLSHAEEEVQKGAIEAIGLLAHPLSPKTLLSFYKTSQSEPLRNQTLEALANAAPRSEDLLRILQEYSTSPLVSRETCQQARRLLLKVRKGSAADRFLAEMREEVIDQVYDLAGIDPEVTGRVLRHGRGNYHRLSPRNRMLLVRTAAASPTADSLPLLLQALSDADLDVRRAAFQALGDWGEAVEPMVRIVELLSRTVESAPELEEEAQQAIYRLDRVEGNRGWASFTLRRKVFQQVQELARQLQIADRMPTSDTHELGWLITRSREYVEYYADTELKSALLNYLKGSPNYGPVELLKLLKGSAVKVEVRHFEGFNALRDLIKNPKRPGMALVTRELTAARLGRRDTMNRLIRNLLLLSLLRGDVQTADERNFVLQLYTWARESRLFRLAEAALYALSRYDRDRTLLECRRCLAVPVSSKILAITATRLANVLGEADLETELVALLASTSDSSDDSYIALNIIDSLSARKTRLPGQISGVLLNCFRREHNPEILARMADCLGEKAGADLLEGIYKVFPECNPGKRDLLFVTIDRLIRSKQVLNREGLGEFLYRILHGRECGTPVLPMLLLWRIGDGYALQLLQEAFRERTAPGIAAALRLLQGEELAGLTPALAELLPAEDAGIQEALRGLLPGLPEGETRRKLLQAAVRLRGAAPEEAGDEAEADEQVEIDFQPQKKSYRFEREYIQDLAILFTDIQGYTKKAQALTAMQLAALIQEYERILIPIMQAHRGELIKTMGDGHLFVFEQPLNAVLAAVRFQKSLKRFNTYKEENLRLTVRVGIHVGNTIRKEGDILGNNVNIASRLENSAQGGSVLISEAVFEQVRDHVLAREIGLIHVKGVTDPIKVYEPGEIALELPAELDPLRAGPGGRPVTGHPAEAAGTPAGPAARPADVDAQKPEGRRRVSVDAALLESVFEAFNSINRLCLEAQAGKADAAAIRQEVVRRWKAIRSEIQKGLTREHGEGA